MARGMMTALLILVVLTASGVTMKLGGTGAAREATPEVQELVDEVRHEVQDTSGRTFSKFTAVSYATQIVAGTNYFVKVAVGDEEYIHLRVFRSLTGSVHLSAFALDKAASDELKYFEKRPRTHTPGHTPRHPQSA
eukprot:RCo038306